MLYMRHLCPSSFFHCGSLKTKSSSSHQLILSIALTAITYSSTHGAEIPVPNGSFETPTPPSGSFVTTQIDIWTKAPQPEGFPLPGGYSWDQLSGAFPNTPAGAGNHIDNLDGNQAAYFLAIPGVGLSQTLEARFEVGNAYQLTFGILGGGGIAEGSSFAANFFFRDGAKDPQILASKSLSFTAAEFPTVTHLNSYTVNLPTVEASDPWAGKPIGLQLLSTFGTGAGYWDVDNIRLVSIPEPSGVALLTFGALALIRRRRAGLK